MMINISLNGNPHKVAGPLSVDVLLRRLDLDPKKVAIERNLEILPKSKICDTLVAEGDQFEIVQFVGGG